MGDIFFQLTIILTIAVVISFIMKLLRQPLIIGYILTGVVVGPSLLSFTHHDGNLEFFSSLGVALLLFILGLGLNPAMIKDVGKVSLLTGIAQIVFTSLIGVVIGLGMGFDLMSTIYMAIAFTLSSTIIVLQLLEDKEAKDSLYGRISIGLLLVQDVVAMLIFVVLSSAGTFGTSNIFITLAAILIKMAIVGMILYLIWKFLIPIVDQFVSYSRQLQFLFAIALCFSTATIFHLLGFSLELGALIAGILLSTSPNHREMAYRIQPLRDFFLVIFFISLGITMNVADVMIYLSPIVVFTLFVVVGNPLIVLIILTKTGHTRKIAFFAGLTIAQISEFSLIMLAIGVAQGHITPDILAVGTAVGVLTIAISSYMVTFNEQIYNLFEPLVRFITPWAADHEDVSENKESYDIIIFGGHRTGGGIIKAMKQKKYSYVVIDHDPSLIKTLREQHVPALFGSADDTLFLDELDMSKTKMVISTVPDIEINTFLLAYFRKRNPTLQFISLANHRWQALKLYELGATYVVMPHYLGRQYMTELFQKNLFNAQKYNRDRKQQIIELQYLKHSF